MNRIYIIALILTIALGATQSNHAVAQSIKSSPYENESVRKQTISKGEAIAVVKRQLEGKILSVSLIDSQGPPVYRVKVLLDKGRVRTVFVDASNGRVVRIR